MDIESTTPTRSEIAEAKKAAVKHLVRRFLVVLGITLVVGFVLSLLEKRMDASDTPDIIL